MPLIVGRTRSEPRVWQREMETLAEILIDQAWIVRRFRDTGTVRGAPNYTQVSLGPYQALMAFPTYAERRQADRYQIDLDATLSIACDVEPYVSDFVDVASREDSASAAQNELGTYRYRITAVQEIRSRFDARPIYGLSLAKLEED
jgi:hypothetical protein